MRAARGLQPLEALRVAPRPSERFGTVLWRGLVWMLLIVFSLMALLIGMSGAAEAQEVPPAEIEVLQVDAEFPPQVWVELTVIGGPVGTLTADDFVIEGMEPGTALGVRPVSTEGLRVVLVVDTSGSMRGDPIETARRAASDFIGLLPAGTEIAVVSGGAGAELVHPMSTDVGSVLEAVGSLRAEGETAVHDAVMTALGVLGPAAADEQRFVVMLTDGADTVSTATIEEATGAVAGADITFHGVSLETSEFDTSSILALADATDAGLVVPATDTAALNTAFDRIGAAVVGRYELTFIAAAGIDTAVGLASGAPPVALGVTSLVDASPGFGTDVPTRPTFAPTTTIAPIVVPEPVAELGAEPEGFSVEKALPIGIGLVGGALLVLLMVLTWPVDEGRQQKSRPTASSLRDDRPQRASSGLGALPDIADLLFGRFVKTGRMNKLLEQAGLPWRAGEYLVLVGAATVVTAMAGAVLFGHILGGVAGLFGPTLGRLYLIRKSELRKKAFREQLHGSLQLLSSNLRVGHALLGALDSVANETTEPTSLEFKRVVGEVRLGRPLGEALQAMADRLESEDLQWVGEAVEIQRDVGGDLAEVLDNVAETLAERSRLEGQVAALAADGKMSAAVMLALPFVVGVLMTLTQPDYLLVFIEKGSGRILLAVGLALLTVGGLWLKKLTKLVF
jgi:tight adherence protein B